MDSVMSTTPPDSTSATTLAVIPARYGSSRFPGKPLALINGLPMVVRVWQQVQQARLVNTCVVATDDERIANVVSQAGGQVCMTQPNHPSGTDRMWEAAQTQPNAAIIVNVQGDEPFIDPATIDAAITALHHNPTMDIATLAAPIATDDAATLANPNVVKAVLANYSATNQPSADAYKALYFSRAAIPFTRNPSATPPTATVKHVGLYAYRRQALKQFISWPPSPLEQAECLEQLRALENGLSIGAVIINKAPIGIDTPEDLAAAEALWQQQHG